MTSSDGKMLHMALSIHNPLEIGCDLDDWTAKGILGAASMSITKIPFKSPSSMYIYEQRGISKGALKILKTIEIDKAKTMELKGILDACPERNPELTSYLRELLMKNIKYDAIQYINTYECDEDNKNQDPTCYIVFSQNQMKSLEPTYENGVLIPLSSRFDIKSTKFTH